MERLTIAVSMGNILKGFFFHKQLFQKIFRQGEAKLHKVELTSVFHHLPYVGAMQSSALAHLGCAGTS